MKIPRKFFVLYDRVLNHGWTLKRTTDERNFGGVRHVTYHMILGFEPRQPGQSHSVTRLFGWKDE